MKEKLQSVIARDDIPLLIKGKYFTKQLVFCVTSLGGLYLEGFIFGILRYVLETTEANHGPEEIRERVAYI